MLLFSLELLAAFQNFSQIFNKQDNINIKIPNIK